MTYALTEDASLNLISFVTDFRNHHLQRKDQCRTNVIKGRIINVLDEASTSSFTSRDPHASSSFTALDITVLVSLLSSPARFTASSPLTLWSPSLT